MPWSKIENVPIKIRTRFKKQGVGSLSIRQCNFFALRYDKHKLNKKCSKPEEAAWDDFLKAYKHKSGEGRFVRKRGAKIVGRGFLQVALGNNAVAQNLQKSKVLRDKLVKKYGISKKADIRNLKMDIRNEERYADPVNERFPFSKFTHVSFYKSRREYPKSEAGIIWNRIVKRMKEDKLSHTYDDVEFELDKSLSPELKKWAQEQEEVIDIPKDKGEFNVVFPFKKMGEEEGDNGFIQHVLSGVASDTSVDRDDDQVEKTFIASMKKQAPGLPMFIDHDHIVDGTIGHIEKVSGDDETFFIERGILEPAWDPEKMPTGNPHVTKILMKLKAGTPLGWSIAGRVTKAVKRYNADLKKTVRKLIDGVLMECTVTPWNSNEGAYVGLVKSFRKNMGYDKELTVDELIEKQSILDEAVANKDSWDDYYEYHYAYTDIVRTLVNDSDMEDKAKLALIVEATDDMAKKSKEIFSRIVLAKAMDSVKEDVATKIKQAMSDNRKDFILKGGEEVDQKELDKIAEAVAKQVIGPITDSLMAKIEKDLSSDDDKVDDTVDDKVDDKKDDKVDDKVDDKKDNEPDKKEKVSDADGVTKAIEEGFGKLLETLKAQLAKPAPNAEGDTKKEKDDTKDDITKQISDAKKEAKSDIAKVLDTLKTIKVMEKGGMAIKTNDAKPDDGKDDSAPKNMTKAQRDAHLAQKIGAHMGYTSK